MGTALPCIPHSPSITPGEPTAITQQGKASTPNITSTARALPCHHYTPIAHSPHEPGTPWGTNPQRWDMGTTLGASAEVGMGPRSRTNTKTTIKTTTKTTTTTSCITSVPVQPPPLGPGAVTNLCSFFFYCFISIISVNILEL